jgi:hypothetical protein
MAAPKGNKYYLLRSKDGREKDYLTPEDLWKACCKYFLYVETHPLKEQKAFSTALGIKKTTLTKKRAMTLAGLRVRIGLSESGYNEYRKRQEYSWVTKAVDDIMYTQKFEGAAAGLLNPNIIARDLGLKDHTDLSSSDGSMSPRNFNDFYADKE